MATSVAVFGGGVAGLSAAHELAERGFDVTVYEQRSVYGGKARSLWVPNSAPGGRRPLPGEHGFRFFPAFYRHLPDTMSRIPYGGTGTVADNLAGADRIWLARTGQAPVSLPAKVPTRPEDWVTAAHVLFTGIGVPLAEVIFFVNRLITLATSCPERRDTEYEGISWWQFIDAANHSDAYKALLAEGLTRSLVAMRAEVGSTRTVGYILLQLLYGILAPSGFDRVLNGPTDDVWLTPWQQYLSARNVKFVSPARLVKINTTGASVTGAVVDRNGAPQTVGADFYIAAVPVEIMQELIQDPSLVQNVPSLSGLNHLCTAWMNGVQFFLRQDVPLNKGHTLYVNSPWALTSISQNQFWPGHPLAAYGDGSAGGVLSVDISEWEKPGILYGKPAKQCTAQELKDEVWAQLQAHLNVAGAHPLDDSNRLITFLDTDIQLPNPAGAAANAEPLLINSINTLPFRPDARTALGNLFLASDYVKTYTDVACMESANEAARRAVNGVLDHSGSTASRAAVWPLSEPETFAPLIALDRIRFKQGLPHRDLG